MSSMATLKNLYNSKQFEAKSNFYNLIDSSSSNLTLSDDSSQASDNKSLNLSDSIDLSSSSSSSSNLLSIQDINNNNNNNNNKAILLSRRSRKQQIESSNEFKKKLDLIYLSDSTSSFDSTLSSSSSSTLSRTSSSSSSSSSSSPQSFNNYSPKIKKNSYYINDKSSVLFSPLEEEKDQPAINNKSTGKRVTFSGKKVLLFEQESSIDSIVSECCKNKNNNNYSIIDRCDSDYIISPVTANNSKLNESNVSLSELLEPAKDLIDKIDSHLAYQKTLTNNNNNKKVTKLPITSKNIRSHSANPVPLSSSSSSVTRSIATNSPPSIPMRSTSLVRQTSINIDYKTKMKLPSLPIDSISSIRNNAFIINDQFNRNNKKNLN
jgi:hypothetical protein